MLNLILLVPQLYELLLKKIQTPSLTTRKVVVPVNLFLAVSRKDLDDGVSTPTMPFSRSFSERLTMSRLLGTQSDVTQERTSGVSSDNNLAPTTGQPFVNHYNDLIRDSQITYNLKQGDKNKQVLTVFAEDEDKEIMKAEGDNGENTKETKESQEEESREKEKLGNKRGELFTPEDNNSGVDIYQNTDMEEDKMKDHSAKPNSKDSAGTIREQDVTVKQDKYLRQGEGREETAEKKVTTKMNTNNSSIDEAENQRLSLTREGAEASKEEPVNKEDITLNREIVREDMTYVTLGPTTHSREFNKGHTVTNVSSCCSLIKQSGAPEHQGTQLGGEIAQIAEMKSNQFPYKMTSNQRPLHSTLRSQSPKLSRMTYVPTEPYTEKKSNPFTHRAMFTQYGAASSLTKESTPSTSISCVSLYHF